MKIFAVALALSCLLGCSKSVEDMCREAAGVCSPPKEEVVRQCIEAAEGACGEAWVDLLECSDGKLECRESSGVLTAEGEKQCGSKGDKVASCLGFE